MDKLYPNAQAALAGLVREFDGVPRILELSLTADGNAVLWQRVEPYTVHS
jgi:hypothetical protein